MTRCRESKRAMPGRRTRTSSRSEESTDSGDEPTGSMLTELGQLTRSAVEMMRRLSNWDIVNDRLPLVTDASPTRREKEVMAFRKNHRGRCVTGSNSTNIGAPPVIERPSKSPARSPFAMPKHYISLRTPVRRETADYDLDSDDEDWLDRYNDTREKSGRTKLQTETLELAMSYIVVGKEVQLRDLAEGCDIEHHLNDVVTHARRRTTKERDWLYPAIFKRASEAEGPYACFMDYDVKDEPMAKYPTPMKKRVYEHSPEPKTPPHDLASPAPKPTKLGRGRPTSDRAHFFEPAASNMTQKVSEKFATQRPVRQKRFAEPAVGGRRSKRRALGTINR